MLWTRDLAKKDLERIATHRAVLGRLGVFAGSSTIRSTRIAKHDAKAKLGKFQVSLNGLNNSNPTLFAAWRLPAGNCRQQSRPKNAAEMSDSSRKHHPDCTGLRVFNKSDGICDSNPSIFPPSGARYRRIQARLQSSVGLRLCRA